MNSKHRSGPGRPGHTPAHPDLARRANRRARNQVLALRLRVAYLFLLTALIAATFTAATLAVAANRWWIAASVVAGVGAALYVVLRDHAHALAAGYRGWRDHIIDRAHREAFAVATAAIDRAPKLTPTRLAHADDMPTERMATVQPISLVGAR